VNFTALPTTLNRICRRRTGSPRSRALLQRDDIRQDAPHVEVDALELEPAGFDLREVEDLVDELEEPYPTGRWSPASGAGASRAAS
jgi:hypothetical protein